MAEQYPATGPTGVPELVVESFGAHSHANAVPAEVVPEAAVAV